MKKIVKDKIIFYVDETSSSLESDFWRSVEDDRWENETYLILKTFLNEKNSYIDIGAWIGPTVLLGSQIARHCYAIEPDPVAFKVLKNNIELNPAIVDRITLFRGCIADICGKVKFGTKTSFGDSSSSLLFDKDNAIDVDSLTLDEFISKYSINDCNFIKMDIEGGEAVVMPKIEKYLKSNMPTLYLSLHPFFFKDRAQDSAAIIDALKIYPNLYTIAGARTSLSKLNKMMLDEKRKDSFSVIADKGWSFNKRLNYIFINKWQKFTNKIKKFIRRSS